MSNIIRYLSRPGWTHTLRQSIPPPRQPRFNTTVKLDIQPGSRPLSIQSPLATRPVLNRSSMLKCSPLAPTGRRYLSNIPSPIIELAKRLQQTRTIYTRSRKIDAASLVTPVLLAINTGVFLAWTYARWEAEADPFRGQSLLRFMTRNFITSYENVVEHNRWWTLVTSSFSHSMLLHFGINMVALWSFGPMVGTNVKEDGT
jgi:membrane associated rhomboid family serine protease